MKRWMKMLGAAVGIGVFVFVAVRHIEKKIQEDAEIAEFLANSAAVMAQQDKVRAKEKKEYEEDRAARQIRIDALTAESEEIMKRALGPREYAEFKAKNEEKYLKKKAVELQEAQLEELREIKEKIQNAESSGR